MISVYCDGSAHSKPGLPGGWAFLIVSGDDLLRTGSGSSTATTNNRMELTAAIEALEALSALPGRDGAEVELVSDSRYCLDVAAGRLTPRNDAELAQRLRALAARAGVCVRWVRGHSGNLWNERCDTLAHSAKQSRVPARVLAKQARRRESRGPRR